MDACGIAAADDMLARERVNRSGRLRAENGRDLLELAVGEVVKRTMTSTVAALLVSRSLPTFGCFAHAGCDVRKKTQCAMNSLLNI